MQVYDVIRKKAVSFVTKWAQVEMDLHPVSSLKKRSEAAIL